MPSTAALEAAAVPTTLGQGGPKPLEAEASRLMLAAVSRSPQWGVDSEQGGVSIGEGLAPVPWKMAEKIWRWEFVEMGDLLPENGMLRTEEGSSNPLGVVRHRRQITDVLTSVICRRCRTTPNVRSSREFAELAWAQYDTSYRRHATNGGATGSGPELIHQCMRSLLLEKPRPPHRAASCVPQYFIPQKTARSPLRRRWRRHSRQCCPRAAAELVVTALQLIMEARPITRASRCAENGTTSDAIISGAATATFA